MRNALESDGEAHDALPREASRDPLGAPSGLADWRNGVSTIEIRSWMNATVLWSGEAADLRDALLQAVASRANLSRAALSRADLSGADLSRADLSGADLSGADLSGAHLSGA